MNNIVMMLLMKKNYFASYVCFMAVVLRLVNDLIIIEYILINKDVYLGLICVLIKFYQVIR